MTATDLAAVRLAPEPAYYPDGTAGTLRAWDGQAWMVHTAQDPQAPKNSWHRNPVAFLAHKWFWVMFIGLVIAALMVPLYAATGSKLAVIYGGLVAGFFGVSGFIILAYQRLSLKDVAPVWQVLVWGAIGGGFAMAVAPYIDGNVGVRIPEVLIYSLAGVSEETVKLVVPVALWFTVPMFRNPRAGLAVAIVVGAMFGIIENSQYVTTIATGSGDGQDHIIQAFLRPVGELNHIFWTGFVVAVAWIAAHQRGKLFTKPAIIAWLVAVFVHSFHDAILALPGDLEIVAGITAEVVIPILSFYLLYRWWARELTPPGSVIEGPKGWVPRWRWFKARPVADAFVSAPAVTDGQAIAAAAPTATPTQNAS